MSQANEGETHLHDDSTMDAGLGTVEDRLATSRLPSLVAAARPPLPPARVPSVPPGRMPSPPVSFAPPPDVTLQAPPSDTFAPPPVAIPRVGAPRSSWWRALIASTLPPPAAPAPETSALQLDPLRLRAVAITAGAGTLSILAALGIALRGAPPELLLVPAVAVSIVLARCAMGLALFALGAGLLRFAERLLLNR